MSLYFYSAFIGGWWVDEFYTFHIILSAVIKGFIIFYQTKLSIKF